MPVTIKAVGQSGFVRKVKTPSGPQVLDDLSAPLISGELKLCAYTWSEVQSKHDKIKAAGGGELHFVPGATYAVPLDGKVTIDGSYVSLKFNRAKIDVSAYCTNGGTFGVIFHINSTKPVHSYDAHMTNRVIEDGYVVGDTAAFRLGQKVGPTAFLFHATTNLSSNRVQFDRMRVIGCYKGLSYGSRSYFIRVGANSAASRCWAGVYSEACAEDFAEKNTFDNTVLAENTAGICTTSSNIGYATFNMGASSVNLDWHRLLGPTAGVTQGRVKFSSTGTLPNEITAGTTYYVTDTGLTTDSFRISTTPGGAPLTLTGSPTGTVMVEAFSSGQIFTMNNCSIDYNDQMFNLGNGTKLVINSANWEQAYGNDAGEVLPPISLTGANTGIFGTKILIYRNKEGLGTDPFYPSFVVADNASQTVDLEIYCARGLGRTSVTSPDAFVTTTNNVTPAVVRVLFFPDGLATSDLPTMSVYSDTANIGLLQQGASWLYNNLINATTKSGTANGLANDNTDAIPTTSVGGVPATVTRKAGMAMTVLQNGTPGTAAKYYITFLTKDFGARHAWSFFYNTQAVTGAIVVKEMQATFAPKFDGTTVTWGLAPNSPAYTNASGITLTAASDWRLHGWKEHTSSVQPSRWNNTCSAITIEIDMTNATGKLLLSHAGFDVLTLSR